MSAPRLADRYSEAILATTRQPFVVLAAPDLRVVSANPAFQELFGVTEHDAINMPIDRLSGGAWADGAIRDQLLATMNGGAEQNDWPLRCSFPHAPDRRLLLSMRSLQHAEGGFLLIAVEDVTERTNAVEALAVTAAELSRSNEELAAFASAASHDLQEPLRKIRAFGERLQSRCASQLDAEGLDYLSRIVSASERMSVLINDLLVYSRAAHAPLQARPVDLATVVREVVTDLETAIAERGATVRIGSLPTVRGDQSQLRRVMQNLISNALKFGRPDTAAEVTIESLSTDTVHEISVVDNGIGFDQKYARRIFGMFQRLHGRQDYPGTGMGLALCSRIVERHGGTIDAEGVPGKGARFTIRLPVT